MTTPATNAGVRYQRLRKPCRGSAICDSTKPVGGDRHSNRTRGSSSEWMMSVNR